MGLLKKTGKFMIYIEQGGKKVDVFSTVDASLIGSPPSLSDKSSQNYVICFTERSGSTMLRSLLNRTGVMGNPEEYVNPRGPVQYFFKRYPSGDILTYFNNLRCYTKTPNGVFGMKTNFYDFKPLLAQGLVGVLLSPVKFIYLDRKDIVLQAISSFIARQSGKWHTTQKVEAKDVEFDEKGILNLLERLLKERLEWERFFTLYNINPLRVSYEDLLFNAEIWIKQILKFVEVEDTIQIDLQLADTKKIGNTKNDEWANRIRDKYVL